MSLKEKVVAGIRWNIFGSVSTTFVQFLQNIILARLLIPEDFGLMTLVLITVGIILPIFDLGLSSAIIQKKEISQNQLSTMYWLNVAFGIALFIFLFFTAPVFQIFFEEIDLTRMIRITSVIFLIMPWGSQFNSLLSKNLKFKEIQLIAFFGAIASFFVSIGLAFLEFGVYSLIAGYLSYRVIECVLNIKFGWKYQKISKYFNLAEVKSLLEFGIYQTGTVFINYLSANIDKIIIGKLLGTYALGLYTIAWNLIILPLRKINPIANKIAFPVFSQIQSEIKKVSSYYSNSLFLLMIINFPILLFFAIESEGFLTILYGNKWIEASSILSILAIVGILKSISNPGGSLLLSKGKANITFFWNMGWQLFLTLTIVIFLLIKPSIESAAYAQLTANIFAAPLWHWIVMKYGKADYTPIIRNLFVLILYSLPALIIVYSIDLLSFDETIVSLILKLILGILSYVVFLFLFFKTKLLNIYNYLR